MCRSLICSASCVAVFCMLLTSTAKADLVGWWKLDAGSETTAVDSSGHGNDLTLKGDPQWAAGRIGGAMAFDGNDGASAATVSRVLRPASALTVCAWVKADPATSGWSWVAGQGDNYGLVVDRDNDNDVLAQAEMNSLALVAASPADGKAAPVEKKYIVHPVCHAHIDMNWLWPWEDTVDTFRVNWESMLKRMDKHAWFVFVQSSPQAGYLSGGYWRSRQAASGGEERPWVYA